MKFPNDFIRRTDVVTMRMCSKIKIKVILCDTNTVHIINYLLFKALSGIDIVSQWIAWVTAIRIITVFSGVNHSKVSIALKQDGITVIRKRNKMNF